MSEIPPTREVVVHNLLWHGIALACYGINRGDTEFRGNFRSGSAKSEDGQGSNFWACWSESGVLVLLRDFAVLQRVKAPLLTDVPDALSHLTEVLTAKAGDATGAAWICDSAIQRLPKRLDPASPGDFRTWVESFFGCPLVWGDSQGAERRLHRALAGGELTISPELGRDLLSSSFVVESVLAGRSVHSIADQIEEGLSRFGFHWLERAADINAAMQAIAASETQ